MTLAIVQARMGSTRFPGKVLKKIGDLSLIEILLTRLIKSKKIDKIVLATSNNKKDDILVSTVQSYGFEVYRGSENDVLDRYFQAAKSNNCETIVRITGDCPLVDPLLVDKVIQEYEKEEYDYVSNIDPPTFPDGLDIEVFSFSALEFAYKNAKTINQREHVTLFIRSNKNIFKQTNYSNKLDYSKERWTVDDFQDFKVIKSIIEHFMPSLTFSWLDVLKLKNLNPKIFNPNKKNKRNIGSNMLTGQKLWQRAKAIIPGGSMLLSKRPEMFYQIFGQLILVSQRVVKFGI